MKPEGKGQGCPSKWQIRIAALLLVALAVAAAVPAPAEWGTAAKAQERLFSLVGVDYSNPLLCSARGVQILNSELNGDATVAGYDTISTVLSCAGNPEIVGITRYAGDIFAVLGAQIVLRDPSMVNGRRVFLSESFWRRVFFETPDILGQSFRLQGDWYEVAGVVRGTDANFAETDIWMPISSRSQFGTMTCFRVLAAVGENVNPAAVEKNFGRALKTDALQEQVAERQATRLLPVEASVVFEATRTASIAQARNPEPHENIDALGHTRLKPKRSII